MVPVANKPILFYLLTKLVQTGVEEVAVVVHPSQEQITTYLRKCTLPLKITIFYQAERLGIAHALRAAEEFIGAGPFILLLGDNLILEPLESLCVRYRTAKDLAGVLLLYEVENPSEYGVAEVEQGRVFKLVEKPAQPKSPYVVAGAYLLPQEIFTAIKKIRPSARGEYEITDAVQFLIDEGHSFGYVLTDLSYVDVGTPKRWLLANHQMLVANYQSRVAIGANCKFDNVKLLPPVVVGDNVMLSNASVGPYVTIGSEAEIMNCELSETICLSETKLDNVTLTEDILAPWSIGLNTAKERMINDD
jgi:glucose-1-phosphate thymidylyltransferase